MTELEVQVSLSLQRTLQQVVGPAGPTNEVHRRIRVRRVSLIASVVFVLAVVGLATTSLASFVKNSTVENSTPPPAATGTAPTLDHDDRQKLKDFFHSPTIASQIDRSGDRKTIAEGKTWWVKGLIGRLPDGKEILCLNFHLSYGSTGFDCGALPNGLPRGREMETVRYTDEGQTAYFGIASQAVQSIETELEDSSSMRGHLYEVPKEWTRIDQFFVAFSPEYEDKALIARDSEGNVIARHSSSGYKR